MILRHMIHEPVFKSSHYPGDLVKVDVISGEDEVNPDPPVCTGGGPGTTPRAIAVGRTAEEQVGRSTCRPVDRRMQMICVLSNARF